MSSKHRSDDLPTVSEYSGPWRLSYAHLLLLLPILPALIGIGGVVGVVLPGILAAVVNVLAGSMVLDPLGSLFDVCKYVGAAAVPVLAVVGLARWIKADRALPQVSTTGAAVLAELDALVARAAPLASQDAVAKELVVLLVTTREAVLAGFSEVFAEQGTDAEHPVYARAREVLTELSTTLAELEESLEVRRAARVASEVAAARLARRCLKVSPALSAVLEDTQVRAAALRLDARDAALVESQALSELTDLTSDLFEGIPQSAGPSDAPVEVALPRESAQRAPRGRELF